jgi:hypothetical protein
VLNINILFLEKSLNIPKGYPEAAFGRTTVNSMTKGINNGLQNTIQKTKGPAT